MAHYARYFCIDRCRIYFSSSIYVCGCVECVPAEVLRPCSTANPADICEPSEGTSLQYDIQGWDHPNSLILALFELFVIIISIIDCIYLIIN